MKGVLNYVKRNQGKKQQHAGDACSWTISNTGGINKAANVEKKQNSKLLHQQLLHSGEHAYMHTTHLHTYTLTLAYYTALFYVHTHLALLITLHYFTYIHTYPCLLHCIILHTCTPSLAYYTALFYKHTHLALLITLHYFTYVHTYPCLLHCIILCTMC